MVVFVVNSMEVKPDPPANQDKVHKVLAAIANEEKHVELIQRLLGTHNKAIGEMKRGTQEFGIRLGKVRQ